MALSRLTPALRFALVFGSVLALPGIIAAACVNTNHIDDTGSGGAGGDDGTICVLHNCQSDIDCTACSEGRQSCDTRNHRCVACDAIHDTGCAEGEYCSQFGSCVPTGLMCDTDGHGVPTVECASSKDCSACDPLHQVCDPLQSKCVACTQQDT